MNDAIRPTGTQSIERSIQLLRLLATRAQFGWGLTDLARQAGIEKATAHRILARLEQERFVCREADDPRYFPGPMLFELGLSVTASQKLAAAGQRVAARLAKSTRVAVLFSVLSGAELVVAAREQALPQRGLLYEVGHRRPLVSSASGVAMLLALPAAERDALVGQNFEQLAEAGAMRTGRLRRMLDRAIESGQASNLEDVSAGINAFAYALCDGDGRPVASLALAGECHRLAEGQGARFIDMLREECEALHEDLWGDQSLSAGREFYRSLARA